LKHRKELLEHAALERFSKLAFDREKRMIKLKEEVNELLNRLGHEAQYKIVE